MSEERNFGQSGSQQWLVRNGVPHEEENGSCNRPSDGGINLDLDVYPHQKTPKLENEHSKDEIVCHRVQSTTVEDSACQQNVISDSLKEQQKDQHSALFQSLSLRENKIVNGESLVEDVEDCASAPKHSNRPKADKPPPTHNLLQSYMFNKYRSQGYKHDFQPAMVHPDPIDRHSLRTDIEDGQFEDAD